MNKFIKEFIRGFQNIKIFGFCNGLLFIIAIIMTLFIFGGWGIRSAIIAVLGLIVGYYTYEMITKKKIL
jgi:hypothetical protein